MRQNSSIHKFIFTWLSFAFLRADVSQGITVVYGNNELEIWVDNVGELPNSKSFPFCLINRKLILFKDEVALYSNKKSSSLVQGYKLWLV